MADFTTKVFVKPVSILKVTQRQRVKQSSHLKSQNKSFMHWSVVEEGGILIKVKRFSQLVHLTKFMLDAILEHKFKPHARNVVDREFWLNLFKKN